MIERQLIAGTILLVLLLAAFALWRRSRRVRRAPERHLRIDLLTGEAVAKEP
jgi:high-affinity Fe2+/Pb2+ permease